MKGAGGYERFIETNYIRQPREAAASSYYNHNTLLDNLCVRKSLPYCRLSSAFVMTDVPKLET